MYNMLSRDTKCMFVASDASRSLPTDCVTVPSIVDQLHLVGRPHTNFKSLCSSVTGPQVQMPWSGEVEQMDR